jgi:acyl dehydratase
MSLEDLKVGDSIPELKVTPDKYLPYRYAGASGDFNPIHIDPEFARQVGLPGNILHGLWMMRPARRRRSAGAQEAVGPVQGNGLP